MSSKYKIRYWHYYLLISNLLILSFYSCNRGEGATKDSVDRKIEKLVSKMSLEEKVGQMTQVTIDMVLKPGTHDVIDSARLAYALLEKRVGSILNVSGHAYSLSTWHEMVRQIQSVAVGQSPNQLPVLYGIDAIHGANFTKGAVIYPHNIGMGATRNDSLVQAVAKATAGEVRASGIRWNFDPVLGLGRQPLWSRYEETFGEDAYIAAQMGVAAIKGYEGDGLHRPSSVAACMKHFIGYSMPASGKDRTPAYIPEVVLREYFLPPFRAAVKAGVSTVMINSGEVNGVPIHSSKRMLTGVLRDELGFEGVAVSDWEDVIRLHYRHHVAKSPREAVKMAVNAGLDMSMVPLDYTFFDLLVDLVKSGEVSMERIDISVKRILKLKYQVGLFDNPYPEQQAKALFGLPAYKKLAHAAALESVTLVKNEPIDNQPVLPLPKTAKVLIAGPGANNLATLHGSWSYTWQGQAEGEYPNSLQTIKAAIEEKIGQNNVLCTSVPEYDESANYDVAALLRAAKLADYIVLCLGEGAYAELPGVIDDLALDTKQQALAKAAAQVGKPVIYVLTQGRPRIIADIEPIAQGILVASRPGNMGGQAIADILFGDYNPDGKLPFTYQKFAGDIVLYDHKFSEQFRELTPGRSDTDAYKPQWPFGHGLSYTTFQYSNIRLDKPVLKGDGIVQVSVDVLNTGLRGGKTAVELYSRDLFASLTPCTKRLRKYKKVYIPAGGKVTVNFSLQKADLSFTNERLAQVTEPGEFELMIGGQLTKLRYQEAASSL